MSRSDFLGGRFFPSGGRFFYSKGRGHLLGLKKAKLNLGGLSPSEQKVQCTTLGKLQDKRRVDKRMKDTSFTIFFN